MSLMTSEIGMPAPRWPSLAPAGRRGVRLPPLGAGPMGPLAVAALAIGVHLVTAGRYGIFRDELYYIACSRHLAWGYVDHPPLIAGLTWVVVHLLGTGLLALRLLPALAAGGLVLLTAALAREMGGGGGARVMATVAVLAAPIYLLLHHWLTMNAFEPLLWAGVFWCAARMLNTGDTRLWLAIGGLTGVGLETKYSMAFCVAGLVVGLALTRERRLLMSPWAAAGGGCALLLILPNLVWLAANHFPFWSSSATRVRAGRGSLAHP